MTVTIRPATEDDTGVLHRFVVELAEAEEFPGKVHARPEDLASALFGADPVASALVAEVDGEPAGFALYYFAYSTIMGRRTLHLEDLYVVPEHRSRGAGRILLGELARTAQQHACARFEWWVLRTNDPAIAFYRRLGAREVEEIHVMRLEGPGLAELAEVRG
ncbi:GNAT family N-acetyltransferase [Nocardioides sp. T2.26MG-1]|uniref:GNAT family N-acetyltransferase n=1 Tax=Nocardioides sp. T2.26MG-1 TaxID=3041166 RepID=UPI0024774756|nr:Mycothiol acetyltransferase [Nocardioides sp. T2.26MG-1]